MPIKAAVLPRIGAPFHGGSRSVKEANKDPFHLEKDVVSSYFFLCLLARILSHGHLYLHGKQKNLKKNLGHCFSKRNWDSNREKEMEIGVG